MENRRRNRASAFPYLILNIILSALATLSVLWLWNRAQAQKLSGDFVSTSSFQSMAQVATSEATPFIRHELPPLDVPVIEIINVFGAGDLASEEIVLQNSSQNFELWLDGWKIVSSDGPTYTFQSLVLNPNARVQIYTRAGHDTVNNLFWNRSQAVWKSGDQVTLVDYEGNSRAAFTVP